MCESSSDFAKTITIVTNCKAKNRFKIMLGLNQIDDLFRSIQLITGVNL